MRQLSARLLLCALAGCGGGSSEVSLTIDDTPRFASRDSVILTGKSFVPEGSSCPTSAEFIRIGSLGLHQISYSNAATGSTGPVFDQLWVCNSDDGRTMSWVSNPISLAAGDNPITVTMAAGSRRSSATVTLRLFGS